jgi:hypothetical protein
MSSCIKEQNTSLKNDCLQSNRNDSLIKSIINIPDMFKSLLGQEIKYKFLVSQNLKLNNDYYVDYNDTFYVVNKNVAFRNEINTLLIDSVKFNYDSTNVDIIVSYFIMGKYKATETNLEFRYDTNSCIWVNIKKSTTEF